MRVCVSVCVCEGGGYRDTRLIHAPHCRRNTQAPVCSGKHEHVHDVHAQTQQQPPPTSGQDQSATQKESVQQQEWTQLALIQAGLALAAGPDARR